MPFIKHIPWSKPERCMHPEHNPPSMISLKPGTYTWQCPSCKQTTTFIVPEIRCHGYIGRDENQQTFGEFLDWASSEVKTWPKWKQNILGKTV